ncbi:MAG: sodium:proton antiporter [Actinomycetia bacterium]|nr:sodium:proton antiporter [Actinomycetes bacterium]
MSASYELGEQLGFWTLAPFACMLLAVAIMPLACGRWFEHNRNKGIVAFVLGAPTVAYLVGRFGSLGLENAAHTAEEYVSFIMLLFALFTISGGIYLTGNLVATPKVNLAFLTAGAVLASFIGTMGASMVLIRPLLRANAERTHSKHSVIFFIFAVSNVGGLLTPLGDPPLFLGFLRGVPFTWTFRLWGEWLLVVVLVLAVYFAFEVYYYRKEPAPARRVDTADYVPMRIKGGINILFLALVIMAVLFSGPLARAGEAIHFPFVRELILAALAVLSLTVGPKGPRASNHFSWAPIVEVAVLFAGIFATMIPALALLEANGASIGLTRPWQYFWATGGLSSFLDNAPTYLTFTSMAQGQVGVSTVGALTSAAIVPGLGFAPADFLAAISCGAVMMGANTYIGNAPNFAVKCIAEKAGVKMPSFFGYMGYSIAILLPIFAIVTAVFFL